MTLTFNDRFAMVTAVSYRPGYATLHGAGKRIELASGSHSLGASTGARYWLLRPGQNLSWEMHSALGLVFGGSPAYQDLFGSSTVSAVLGSTLAYRIGRREPQAAVSGAPVPSSFRQRTSRKLEAAAPGSLRSGPSLSRIGALSGGSRS